MLLLKAAAGVMGSTERSSKRLRITPEATAEATIAEAEMALSMGSALDDHLAGRLESIAQNPALPQALRARALVNLCRFR